MHVICGPMQTFKWQVTNPDLGCGLTGFEHFASHTHEMLRNMEGMLGQGHVCLQHEA